MKITLIFLGLCFILILSCNDRNPINNDIYSLRESPEQKEKRVQWFRDAKIGVIFHWGPGSLTGKELSWSRIGVRREKLGDSLISDGGIFPSSIYDSLYNDFSAELYNPEQWIQTAKLLGAEYSILVTKHHDGFCVYDTETTDYKITSERCPADFDAAELFAEACRRNDMKLGFYYSQTDWYDPDFMTYSHNKYIDKMHRQIEELLTNYGDVSVLWFDNSSPYEYWDTEKLIKNVKETAPNIIINDRIKPSIADFFTPEGFVGGFNNNFLWESVLTIGWNWSWVPEDEIRPVPELIKIITKAIGNDGNILIGIGPHPDGYIPEHIIDTVAKVGDFITKYGESLYSTRGGPYIFDSGNATCTYKDGAIYLHIFNWYSDNITLPDLNLDIAETEVLTGGEIEIKYKQGKLIINLPAKDRHPISTIIKLKTNNDISLIKPIKTEF